MNTFVDRFSTAFGKSQGLMLKLTGLLGGEVSAWGPWVIDSQGEQWLDFGSFGVHLLGHSHPEVIGVAQQQLQHMGLSTKILGNEASTRCAETLLDTLPDKLVSVTFANSGAEIVESALKMALLNSEANHFIAFKNSYHGKTLGALCVSDSLKKYQQLNKSLLVHFVELGDIQTVETLLMTGSIAALIIEPMQGEGGIVPVPRHFLAELARLSEQYQALLIFDEIQTGLGRCGQMWRGVAADCVPDILLIGKVLGGGIVPISAAAFTPKKIGIKASDPLLHASSFAGGAFACAIAQKVIELVKAPTFLDTVNSLGMLCKSYLKQNLVGVETVVDIRGEGLMLGIEFVSSSVTANVIIEAARRKLLLTFCLNRPEVLRFYPPAVTSKSDLLLGLDRLLDAIHATPAPS